MRVTVLMCLLLGLAYSGLSQTIQSVRFVVNVNSLPIAINAGEIQLEGLQAGTTYSTVPDGAGGLSITPNDGLATVASATETSISGDMNSKILLTFVLPTGLYPSSGAVGGFVRTRFTVNSAAWGASGAEQNYFDPNTPVQITLDASGSAFVSLGGIFEVSPNATADQYVGDALLIAQYTGL